MTFNLHPHPSIGQATWELISCEREEVGMMVHVSCTERCALNVYFPERQSSYRSDDGTIVLPYDAFLSAEKAKLYIFGDATAVYDVPIFAEYTNPPMALETAAEREHLLAKLDWLLAENQALRIRLAKIEKTIFHDTILGL